MTRLIVASNRVTMPSGKGGVSQGGLAMALAAALRAYRGIWFGWSGGLTPEFTGQLSLSRSGGVTVATVDLEEQDVQEYYNGYANKTLWPLCHYRIDLTAYDRTFGSGYERVNRRLAETLRPLVEQDDVVWVHDYHLVPLGRELRALGVDCPLGFFLHIPWPPRQLFTTLPRHDQLVRALFEYDLIGFQTEEWLEAFRDYVVKEAGGEVGEDGALTAYGRTIRAKSFPIGIDPEEFDQLTRSGNARRMLQRMKASAGGRDMIVGVDRLDYSKGLEERFSAYQRFLEDNPEFRQRVFLLQIAPPSREDVDAYQQIRARLDAQSGNINAAFAEPDWTPVRYVNKGYRRDELAGVYRAARVCMVTPLRDGMNLVAKEFVAAQDPEDPGVLVLSKFAGAAHQMRDALLVNPYSAEEVSDALRRALTMDLAERKRRNEALHRGICEEDVAAWRDAFVGDLMQVRAKPQAALQATSKIAKRAAAPEPA